MLGPLLSAMALARVKRAAERSARNAMLSALAGLLAAVGAAFLVAAGFVAIEDALGPFGACLVFAALFLFAGLVVWLVKRSRRPAASPMRSAALLGAAGTMSAAGDGDDGGRRRPSMLARASRSKLVLVLPALAFAAAVIAGRRSHYSGDDD